MDQRGVRSPHRRKLELRAATTARAAGMPTRPMAQRETCGPSRITATAEAPTHGLEKPRPTTIPAQVQIVCRMVALLSTGPRRTPARLLLTRVPARRSSADSPQAVAEMLVQGGVGGFRGGDVGFEQHPSVDGQPASVEGLDLVGYCDVGVPIRVTGPTVPVGERGGDEASDADLPDPLRPGPGEQGMILNKCQRVLHGGLMRLFDDGRNGRVGHRPQA